MSIVTDSIHKFAQQIADTTASEYSFPYTTPSRTVEDATHSLFQLTVSDADLLNSFNRNPLSKVIVNDVAEDVFDKGFKIKCKDYATENEETEDEELTKEFLDYFTKYIKLPLLLTYKLARLYGFGCLLQGFNDGRALDKPVKPRATPTFYQAIDKSWIDEIEYKKVDDEYVLPITIERYRMKQEFVASEYIHPSRMLHVENPGIDMLKTGVSALLPCFDDLVVIKHVTWGAGQTMWRSGNMMISVIAPPRASPTQVTAIDNALTDVNAQTAMTFPWGTEFTAHSPAGLNPQPYARIPLDNIAAATRIPLSILIGAQKGALASSLTDARDYAGTLSAVQSNVMTPLLNNLFWTLQKAKVLPYKKFEIIWENTLTISKPEETLNNYRESLTARNTFELEQKKKELEAETKPTEFPPTTIEQPPVATEQPYGPTLEAPAV